jgi:1L-myo-inositol 1-phosphate cytidylyltransferase / CDP-L-myo-inositol myo-inositolphosphotransferase
MNGLEPDSVTDPASAQPRTAVIRFAGARQAERRVAGVAAAGRIVHELAGQGFGEVRLVLGDGKPLGAAASRDVTRLAGRMTVRIANAPPPADSAQAQLSGDRFDHPGASAEILDASGKPGDGPVSRWLNRPVSRRVSAVLLHLPAIRPIHATAATALIAAAMFGALVWGGAAGLVAGAILYQVASILDGVDGEIARATHRVSRSGAAIDTAVDAATNIMFVLGLTINLGLAGNRVAALLAVWGFILFLVGLAAIAWRTSRGQGPFNLDLVKHHYARRFPGRLIPWLIDMATIVSSRDFYALLFMLLILAGMPAAVLYIFSAAATVWILFVMNSLRQPPDPVPA